MSSRAVASHRCFWDEFFQWHTRPVRASSWLKIDSSQFDVFRLMPNSGKTPRRCSMSVSSKPSSRLPTADGQSGRGGAGVMASGSLVAVGTALAGGPPHGSVLEELPHTALTSGAWRSAYGHMVGSQERPVSELRRAFGSCGTVASGAVSCRQEQRLQRPPVLVGRRRPKLT